MERKHMSHFVIGILSAFILIGCSTRKAGNPEPMSEKAEIQYRFSYEAFIQGNLIPALTTALKAAELSPNNADVHNLLGLIYFRQQKYAEAEATFKRAAEIDPKASEIFNNLGTLYYETKRYNLALETLNKALENPLYLYPERIYNNLGLTHEALGDMKQAKESYEKSIQLQPEFYVAYQNLGKLQLKEGAFKPAEKNLREAARICRDCSEPRYFLGSLLIKNKKMQDALRIFKEGADVDPKGYYGQLCEGFLVKDGSSDRN